MVSAVKSISCRYDVSSFASQETVDQRGEMICPSSQRQEAEELKSDPILF